MVAMAGADEEREWQTRKRRIDPALDAAGWTLQPGKVARLVGRTEEEPTQAGPADCALWLDNRIVGIVEAKRLQKGPQEVLRQAERYSGALAGIPFHYATNGEVLWFRDARHPLNLSRRVSAYHTPAALREALAFDLEGPSRQLAP